MYSKQTNASFLKTFAVTIKRIFRARNIIIISDHKVDHVPLSALMQVLLIVGVVGFFSGVSYISGSYVTARNSLREKDRRIVSTTLEKSRIGEEMDLLKHDLAKLSQNGKELSAYSKFVIDQYARDGQHDTTLPLGRIQLSQENLFGQNNEKLIDRITYLEGRLQEIRNENDRLVIAIRERTDKKIAYFEDIIAMTGLDPERLEHDSSAVPTVKEESNLEHVSVPPAPVATIKPTHVMRPVVQPDPNDDDSSKPTIHGENEGGPFIPYDASSLNDADRDLISGVDRLVTLHNIVSKLPLSQPISEAQVTGPFGKRVDPLNGRWAIHPGIDLAGPANAQVFCTSDGKVVSAGRKVAYGNAIDIDHGYGIVTRYAHLSKLLVHEGEFVHKGQLIGIQGSTGRSTGPHLHYEVRINDHPVNPAKFLHAGEYVLEN